MAASTSTSSRRRRYVILSIVGSGLLLTTHVLISMSFRNCTAKELASRDMVRPGDLDGYPEESLLRWANRGVRKREMVDALMVCYRNKTTASTGSGGIEDVYLFGRGCIELVSPLKIRLMYDIRGDLEFIAVGEFWSFGREYSVGSRGARLVP